MAKFGVIRSSWIGAQGAHRLDATFWLRVLDTIEEMGLKAETLTIPDLQRVFKRHDAKIEATEVMIRHLRDRANEILKQARMLDRTLPEDRRRALAKARKGDPA